MQDSSTVTINTIKKVHEQEMKIEHSEAKRSRKNPEKWHSRACLILGQSPKGSRFDPRQYYAKLCC